MRSDAQRFINVVRKLHNLDKYLVLFLTYEKWRAFRDNPINFLMRCDDETLEMIWKAMETRDEKH